MLLPNLPSMAWIHRRSQGGPRGPCPPKFLKHRVILCFERRYSKQNSVICLKSSLLTPSLFWTGYATARIVLKSLLPAIRNLPFAETRLARKPDKLLCRAGWRLHEPQRHRGKVDLRPKVRRRELHAQAHRSR